MNLIKGKINEIYVESGTMMAKARFHGAYRRVAVTFLIDAKVGDMILIESGVSISKVEAEYSQEK
jgi:hydrogenase maturation factor